LLGPTENLSAQRVCVILKGPCVPASPLLLACSAATENAFPAAMIQMCSNRSALKNESGNKVEKKRLYKSLRDSFIGF
jgi:hypothetical protein